MTNPTLMKVYDPYSEPKMPEDVKNALFAINTDAKNDSYVSHVLDYLDGPDHKDDDGVSDYEKYFLLQTKILNDWLIANGAELGETVIISFWW